MAATSVRARPLLPSASSCEGAILTWRRYRWTAEGMPTDQLVDWGMAPGLVRRF